MQFHTYDACYHTSVIIEVELYVGYAVVQCTFMMRHFFVTPFVSFCSLY